ncbi:MAG: hypothetical protein RL385_5390 [Pseudomonadota bacterium]|jgi:hypothetical protein
MQSFPSLARRSLGRASIARSALACVILTASACEWVLGGIPDRPDVADDASATEDFAQADDATAPEANAEQEDASAEDEQAAPVAAKGAEVAAPRATAIASAEDAGVAPGTHAGADAGALADAAQESTDDAEVARDAGAVATSCTDASVWFPDLDGDGYGVEQGALHVCPRPPGSFAVRPGDCHDGDQNVNPGHQRFESAPYTTARGTQSFDYDCSGGEDGTGEQAAHFGCGLLGALACGGDGYASTERTGFSVNSYCGSVVLMECKAELLATLICSSTSRTVAPYLCR